MAELKNWSRYEVDTGWQETNISEVLSNSTMKSFLDTKVDKETGKSLSSNDFTNTYKNTLDNLSNNYIQKPSTDDDPYPGFLRSDGTIDRSGELSTNDFTNDYKNTVDTIKKIIVSFSDLEIVNEGETTVTVELRNPLTSSLVPDQEITVEVDRGYLFTDEIDVTYHHKAITKMSGSGSLTLVYHAQEKGLVKFTVNGKISAYLYVNDATKGLSTNDFTNNYKNTVEGISNWEQINCNPGTLYVNKTLRMAQWSNSGTVSVGDINKLFPLENNWGFSSTYAPSNVIRQRVSNTENLFCIISSDGQIHFFTPTQSVVGNGKSYNGCISWHY